jgi:LysM repeat protein
MLKRSLLVPVVVFALAARAQVPPDRLALANLQEDVRGLTQRVNDLSLQVEQLDRERAGSRLDAGAAEKSYATIAQLNQAVAELNRSIQSAVAGSKDEILQRVGDQMAALARQTNAALDSISKGMPAAAAAGPGQDAARGPQGTAYVVQKGDTVESIAKKTGAGVADIIHANSLADPSLIRIGQTLMIPAAGEK